MKTMSETAAPSSFNFSGREGFNAIVTALENLQFADGRCLASASKSKSEISNARRWGSFQLLLVVLVLCLAWGLPIGLQAQTVVFAGQQTVLGIAAETPRAIALDGAGDLFFADTSTGQVVEVPADGGAQKTIGTGLSDPDAIALDGAGNVYVADWGANTVWKVYANGGAMEALGTGLKGPYGVAVDAGGDVFIIDYVNDRVVKEPAGGGAQTTLISGNALPYTPLGIAADAAGDVFIADQSIIVEVPAGGTPFTLVKGLNLAVGVAVDGTGNLFISEQSPGLVVEWHASNSALTTVASGLSNPGGIAVNNSDQVFIANYSANQLLEAQPVSVGFGSANVCPGGGSSPSPCSQTLTLNYSIPAGGDIATGAALTSGAPNLDFKIASGSTCVGQFAAGGSCSVNVTFTPTRPGLRQGAVQITDDLGNLLATTNIYGAGIGPQIAFSTSKQTTVGSGFTQPFSYPSGVAMDGAGDVFVADTYGVFKIPAGGGVTTTVGTGLISPTAVAVDGAGNVYIVDQGNYSVYEVPAGGGAQITVGSNIISPVGVAVDGMGNVFILDYGRYCVVKVPSAGGAQTFLGTGLLTPLGIALDTAGNLFIADSGNGRIVEIPVDGSAQTTVVSGLELPQGISVDVASNLYIAEGISILEVLVNAGTHATLGTGLNGASGVFVDSAGNVLIADTNNGRVVELPRSQPPALSFASTKVGVASADSPQTAEVQNIGNQPLIFNTATTGTNPSYPAGFPENTADSNLCSSGSQVGPGTSCDVSVSFDPTIAGSNSGNVVLTDNNLNATAATQSIAVSGTGVAQTISLSATTLSFPSTTVGAASSSQSVTMTNTGSITLSITSIAVTGTNASSFVFASTCGASLAVGAGCTIHGHFAPTSAGALTATVAITDNASGSPQSIALSGTGVVPVTLSATSLAFGSITVGGTSGSQTVVMTNTGTAALSIHSITVTGTNAASFVFANSCGATLAIGASCTIHGHFTPTTSGPKTAAITITDSASTSPQTITLTGIGVAQKSPVTLSATSLSFGSVTVGGSSASQSVTMTNTGTAKLTITSITVTGTNASQFMFANSCGSSLAVGANCTIHGHFAPTATGVATAIVTIADSAAGSPQGIALSGTGQ